MDQIVSIHLTWTLKPPPIELPCPDMVISSSLHQSMVYAVFVSNSLQPLWWKFDVLS